MGDAVESIDDEEWTSRHRDVAHHVDLRRVWRERVGDRDAVVIAERLDVSVSAKRVVDGGTSSGP